MPPAPTSCTSPVTRSTPTTSPRRSCRSSPRIGAELTGAQSLPGFPPDPRTGGTGSTPVTGAGLPGTIANLPAMRRKWLLWQLAGFTGSDTQNHLITFPEFVAHYLLAWSPRVLAGRCRRSADGVRDDARRPPTAIKPWLNRPWFCNPGEIEPDTSQRAGTQGSVEQTRPQRRAARRPRVSTAAPTRSPATPPRAPPSPRSSPTRRRT